MSWELLDRQQTALLLGIGIISILIRHVFYKYYRLQHIPGPLIAKFTDIHRFLCVRSGFVHLYQAKAHRRYGPIVRFGPNMVTICDPEAIQEVFHKRIGFNKAGHMDFFHNSF